MYAAVAFLIVLGLLWVVTKLADRFRSSVMLFFKKYGCLILLLIFGFLFTSGFWFFFLIMILLAAFAMMDASESVFLSP